MNIDELTLGQLKQIQKAVGCNTPKKKDDLPFKVGDKILIRTVTMIQVGRVRTIGRDFFVLDDAAWVADTSLFSECLKKGTINEVEPFPSWALVGRGAVIDIAPWDHDLPRVRK